MYASRHFLSVVPKSYVFENTCILQTFWNEDECDYQDLGDQLGIDVVTVSSIMQQPGNTIPLHRDTFFQLRKRFPDQSTKSMVRANIFLEDLSLSEIANK